MGPISYLIVEFPGNKTTGEGFEELLALVDQGLINILDLRFVARAEDGSITALELSDIDGAGALTLAAFDGAASGLQGADSYLKLFDAAGNLLAANAFLTGMAREELSRRRLDAHDPYFPLVVGVRAVKR